MEQQELKSEQELDAYKNTKSEFTDYTRFEDTEKRRAVEKYVFINNIEYTPGYKYPQLDFLIDNGDVTAKKTAAQEAIMELEASKNYPDANIAEIELFATFHETRLKRILLVEAARNLSDMGNSEVNRRCFNMLNEELYGEFNDGLYLGMLDSEKNRATNFIPTSEIASTIKSEFESYLENIDFENEHEEALIDSETLHKLHSYVIERYAAVLGAVPETANDVYYDINQCVKIMNNALLAGGLAERGWKAIENPSKSIVSTQGSNKVINLPSSTRRNAAGLRRLIIHEQEIHARRAQNGIDSGFRIIETGTADYADSEEGIAVILECAVDDNLENASFDRARNRYITAGLALGADGQPRDARGTYEILWRMISIQKAKDGNIDSEIIEQSKNDAYSHIDNAYRGTNFWMKGVIYTKLKIYYEGLVKNSGYIKNNIDNLDAAFSDILIGKYNHTDPVEKELVLNAIAVQKAKANATA